MTLDELYGRATITVAECAVLLGVDVRTVARAVEYGQIYGVRVGRRIVIPARQLWKMLADPEGLEQLDED